MLCISRYRALYSSATSSGNLMPCKRRKIKHQSELTRADVTKRGITRTIFKIDTAVVLECVVSLLSGLTASYSQYYCSRVPRASNHCWFGGIIANVRSVQATTERNTFILTAEEPSFSRCVICNQRHLLRKCLLSRSSSYRQACFVTRRPHPAQYYRSPPHPSQTPKTSDPRE